MKQRDTEPSRTSKTLKLLSLLFRSQPSFLWFRWVILAVWVRFDLAEPGVCSAAVSEFDLCDGKIDLG